MNRIVDHQNEVESDTCNTKSLIFQFKRNFRDILFDFSYGAQPTDRVVFQAKFAPTKFVAGLKMLGNEGKLKMERNGKVILIEAIYNQDKLTMNGEFQNMPGNYFLKVDLTSTLEALKTVKLNLVYKITQDQAYPYEWNLEVAIRQKNKITFVAKVTQDLSECNVNLSIVRNYAIVYHADWKLSIEKIQKFLLKLTNDQKFLELILNEYAQSGNFNLKSNFIDEVIEAVYSYLSKNSLKKIALGLA